MLGERSTMPRSCCCPREADAGVWDYFATATIPVPEHVATLLAASGGQVPGRAGQRARAGGRDGSAPYGKVELMLKQLAVDGAVDRVEGGWLRTSQPWAYDAEHYDALIAVRNREADIMRRYVRAEACLMQLLQEALDDPTAERCGRCSVCLGALPGNLAAAPSVETAARVAAVLRGETHVLEPRKMWPGGEFGARGRIPAELMAEPGRVLVFADAPEWRELLAEAGRGPAPAEILDGMRPAAGGVARCTGSSDPTSWSTSPGGGMGDLAAAAADHIAEVGRLGARRLEIARLDAREVDGSELTAGGSAMA